MKARAGARSTTASIVAALCTMLVLAGCGVTSPGSTPDFGPPDGDAIDEVVMARAPWTSGFLQAAIVRQLIEELGYKVTELAERTYPPESAYPLLGRGDIDLWANGWFPLHEPFLQQVLVTGQTAPYAIEPVGMVVPGGAVQGYLIDRATAETMGITSMADLARPEVAAVFDHDGDGRADLYGCDTGWGCHRTITEHLAEHAWGDTVKQVSGVYRELFEEVRERIEGGQPTLFYTWTPNWTTTVLEPGVDVVWLEVPVLPGEEPPAPAAGLEGCAAPDPCQLGWEINDIRSVANTRFLEAHPPIRRLLEEVEIPLHDLAAHHARMVAADRYPNQMIERDAAAWIDQNRGLVEDWLRIALDG